MQTDPPGMGAEHAGVRRAQDVAATAAGRLRGGPLHGRTVDAPAGLAWRGAWKGDQDHGQRQGHAVSAGQGEPGLYPIALEDLALLEALVETDQAANEQLRIDA